MARAFVIRPFGKKKDSEGKEIDFDRVHTDLIEPALKANGIAGGTTGQVVEAGNIREDMFALIIEADLVICDVTVHNANVFYELGLAHALNKPVVLVSSNEPDVPFDLQHIRVIYYDVNDPFWGTKLIEKVAENILSALTNPEEAIFKGTQDVS